MAGEAIFKDIVDVHGRLFDHRPFAKTQINFFIEEFEVKRGNREQTRLQGALENCREINETLIESCIQRIKSDVSPVNNSVKESVRVCHRILDRENEENQEWLAEQRRNRKTRWEEFLSSQCEKVHDANKEFDDEVERVENYYKELEKVLHST